MSKRERPASDPHESVLDAIERTTGQAPSVSLGEGAAEALIG